MSTLVISGIAKEDQAAEAAITKETPVETSLEQLLAQEALRFISF